MSQRSNLYGVVLIPKVDVTDILETVVSIESVGAFFNQTSSN